MKRTAARSCEMNSSDSCSCCCRSLQQIADLRLDRDVERGERLVAHHQFRVRRSARARCRCAAPGRRRIRAGSDAGARRPSPLPVTSRARAVCARSALRLRLEAAQRLGHDVADLHARIERCQRVLEDQLQVPAHRLQRRARELQQVSSPETHLSGLGAAPVAAALGRWSTCRCPTHPPRRESRRARVRS